MTEGTRLSGPHWRRVVAALANKDARTAYAQIVLGARFPDVVADLNDRRRSRAITTLLDAGLVERNAADELEASEAIFRDLLTQQPRRQAQTGSARFMRLGRIERYPANMTERRELLAWIVNEAIEPGEHLTEKQVNERLLSCRDAAPLPDRLRTIGTDAVGLLLLPAGRTLTQERHFAMRFYIETGSFSLSISFSQLSPGQGYILIP